MGNRRVLGIDACKRSWIAIAVESAVTGAYCAEDIRTLIARAEADGSLAIVAIDMPIGLPDSRHRRPT
jgi:predicted RNase H-like nuclease